MLTCPLLPTGRQAIVSFSTVQLSAVGYEAELTTVGKSFIHSINFNYTPSFGARHN